MEESKQSKIKSKRSQKQPENTKKKRRTKDPDAPKRPLGPYFFYFKENNTKIKNENPELNQKAVVARIAANWKLLTEEEKQPFVNQSKQDKLRYVQEKQVYEENRAKKEEEEDKLRGCKNKRGKKSSNKGPYDQNGNNKPTSYSNFDPENEPEVRLADIIGIDQISFPSNSEDLADYSPPRSYDGNPMSQGKQLMRSNIDAIRPIAIVEDHQCIDVVNSQQIINIPHNHDNYDNKNEINDNMQINVSTYL